MSKKTWVTQAAAGGYTHSLARAYQAGVSLVTSPYADLAFREGLLSVSIQNRDNQNIYFWHGRMFRDFAAFTSGTPLPLDVAGWTEQEKIDAGNFLQTYGEQISPGERYTPSVAHYSPVYAYVSTGQAVAHVKLTTNEITSLI